MLKLDTRSKIGPIFSPITNSLNSTGTPTFHGRYQLMSFLFKIFVLDVHLVLARQQTLKRIEKSGSREKHL